MFKNILVPIDLAHVEKDSSLVKIAKDFAKKHDCKLTFLNVIPDFPAMVAVEMVAVVQLPKDLPEKMSSTTRAKLRDLTKKNKFSASTEVRVEHGHPAREILKVAADIHADLILIASHQPGLADYLLGSVAGKVVRHAHCSVLVSRQAV